MKTNLMRCFAVALGLSATALPSAQAQYNPYVTQQTRQPAASRWNNFNVPAQQQAMASQPYFGAPQQQYGMQASQQGAPRQVFRQVAQQDDDLLLPPRTSNAPEQIAPGIAQPNPLNQAPVQQQVPTRGSYQPAPSASTPRAYESTPNDRLSSPSDRQVPTPAPAPAPAPVYQPAPAYQPAPTYQPAPAQSYQPAPAHSYSPAPTYAPQADPYSNAPSMNYAPSAPCESTILDPSVGMPGSVAHQPVNPYAGQYVPQYTSPYSSAMNSSWDEGCAPSAAMGYDQSMYAGRPSLFPWFGGANALFLKTASNSNHALGIRDGRPAIYSDDVAPSSATGWEMTAGRYLKCGTYGLAFSYFEFDPDSEMVTITGTPGVPGPPATNGNIRPAMQGYHDYHLDIDGAGAGTVDQVYNYVTGASDQSNGARAIRARNDLDVQGLDVSLFSFGLMGYGRTTPACGSGGCGILGGLGGNCGYGRLGGPLTRPCANRVQIVTSHGLRWFQVENAAQLAYDIDGAAGYQAQDIYDDVRVSNDLYGYQFGALLSYCVSNNLSLNLGGKGGIYANDVEANRRVGTETQVAYRFGDTSDLAQTSYDDVVLATLGELNAGLGYRIGNAWTINGGYRVLGAAGIATAFDQMVQDFGTSRYPGSVHANDSLILHGAYVGANFNW